MKFIEMLQAPVTPLSEVVTENSFPRRTNPSACTENARKVRHDCTLDKYRSVMGGEWTPTPTIASRLGYNRYSCYPTLRDWEAKGIVEHRKVGGEEGWNRVKGYEWRFVK